MWSAWECVKRIASMRPIRSRNACCRKSGVVSIRTVRPLYWTITDGRRRLSRGIAGGTDGAVQPSVGTPMLVPDPSTVIVTSGIQAVCFAKGFAGLHEPETQFSQRVFDQTLLVDAQISFRLVRNH